MEYQKAKTIRGKSFGELLTDNLISGGGIAGSIKKTLSERSKARMMGIKEKFDPLNIAKALTGGSRLGPALLGKMLGRSESDLKYFAGDPKKKSMNSLATTGLDSESLQSSTESLGRIYQFLKQDRDNKVRQRAKENSFEGRIEKEEELRNRELVKALTARRKKKEKTPKEEKQEKKSETKQKQTEKKTETENKKTEVKKEVDKKQTAEKAKKEEVQKPAEKQKTESAQKKVKEVPAKAAPAPKPAEIKPPTAAKVPPIVTGGAKGMVIGALVSAGYSKQAQANVMANVEKESNFKPRSEEMPGAEKIFTMFGGPEVSKTKDGRPLNKSGNVIRFPTMDDVKSIMAKGPEAYFSKVYDGRMGNTNPGDGYKYRGRGFIQITGKDMYQRIGNLINVDLVKNPDLANEPEIAAKIVPAFFQLKIKEQKREFADLENIDIVNATVGSADIKSREQRKSLAAAYVSELNSGTQIDRASTENKNLKEQTTKDKPSIIVNNNTTTTQNQTPASTSAPVDDRPAYMKKIREQ